ncbi:MAG TPA: FliH/SctL family protein [Polyangiales bacterium]|nr:FliH/SctL family protein [Polyangiales bacterium]
MARVIRAQRTGTAVVRAAVYDAQLEAAALLERAHNDAERIRQTAHAEGYAAGNAAAARQLFDLASLQAELGKRTEHDATQAALLVAGQLLGSALTVEPEKIAALLRPHLARMRRAQRVVLRLHPDDATWLEQNPTALMELREQHTLASSLELRPDPSITRGGCVVESNIGELDARVETRLTLLAAALGVSKSRGEHT